VPGFDHVLFQREKGDRFSADASEEGIGVGPWRAHSAEQPAQG